MRPPLAPVRRPELLLHHGMVQRVLYEVRRGRLAQMGNMAREVFRAMNVAQLRAIIAELPDDMPVVFRDWGRRAKSIAGVHVRLYDARHHQIAEPEDGNSLTKRVRALVLNPHE